MNDPDLIVFGGAFDPPHQGHVECLEACAERFPDAELWVIPTHAPAKVGNRAKELAATFEQRMEMCELAFRTLDFKRFAIKDLERTLPPPSYTLQTLEYVQHHWPQRRLGFLLGFDQLAQFPKWHRPQNILGCASLVAVQRTQASAGMAGEALVKNVARELGLAGSWDEGFLQNRDGNRIYLIKGQFSAAQSTVIRSHLTEKIGVPTAWLPDLVRNYIEARGLYAGENSER